MRSGAVSQRLVRSTCPPRPVVLCLMAASRDRTTAVLALLLAASGSGSAQEQACDDIAGRTTGLQATCCPDGIISCPLNIPTTCEAACAQALLGFVGDCKETFGADALTPVIDPVLALCAAASAGDNSDEVRRSARPRLAGSTSVPRHASVAECVYV